MKILFVAADFGGSSWYRIIQPAGICIELYEDSKWSLPDQLPLSYLQEAEMVILQRQCHEKAFQTTQQLLKMNKVIVSEIDDNLWSIPQNTPALSKFWTKEYIQGFEKILKMSHAVTVSTLRLGKLVKEFNDNVYVIPNLVVFDKNYKKPDYGKIRIGWSGSDTHMFDFTEDVQLALLDIKNKYKDQIDICMFGAVSPMLFTKVSFYPFVPPHLYLANLQKLGLDIGIVPNRENAFNSCRSALKFIEYSSVRAATIASKTDSYSTVIQNGVNGLLLKKNSRKEWFTAIQTLIEDNNLRGKIIQKAYDYCFNNYSVQEKRKQYQVYGEILNKVQRG